MFCLRGLFNSANRYKKACVSHAAEAAVHCWHSLWWGSVPSADLCELTLAPSPGSCPTGEWTPFLRMHLAHHSCQFMLMHFWISHGKQLIFWVRWSGIFTRSLITIFCARTLADYVACEVRHGQNSKDVHLRLGNNLLPTWYTVHTLHLLRCQDGPLWFISVSNNCISNFKFLIRASNTDLHIFQNKGSFTSYGTQVWEWWQQCHILHTEEFKLLLDLEWAYVICVA